MDSLLVTPPDALPIADDQHEQLLAPILAAVETALREVALSDSVVRATYRIQARRLQGDVVAMLELSSGAAKCLTLGVSLSTATALARRVLSETLANADDALICDCLGEIANVAAGQAKALLHGTPYHFTFGTPHATAAGMLPATETQECFVAVMATDVGDVVVQLFLTTPRAG
jgi:chemotaxis protein CheX